MKKVLLSLVAVFAAISTYAQYKVDDYIFTSTGKYKVKSVLTVPALTSWTGYSAEIFSPYTAEASDPEDKNGILSARSDEGDKISTTVKLEASGNYLVSFYFKSDADGSSSITDGTQNQLTAWISADGTTATQQVATVATLKGGEWVNVAWAFADTLTVNGEAVDGTLNILFSRVNTDAAIAEGVQVLKVDRVYDTRIADAKFAYIANLLADPNLNVTAAAEPKAEVEDAVAGLKEAFDGGELDEETVAEESIDALDDLLAAYLDVTTQNLADHLANIDIASGATFGRGRAGSMGCFTLGGNWGHITGDILRSAIQTGYEHSATLTVSNADFPAGKYFFTAEIRNANTTKESWPCTLSFNLVTDGVKAYVGNDTLTIDSVAGEQFQRFYLIGNVAKDGEFSASIYWPGVKSGGAFEVRGVEVRAFGDVEAEIARKKAVDTFLAQWNAAVSARKKTLELKEDANYPYGKDSLDRALAQWDPYYNKVLTDKWVDEEGNVADASVVTNEELIEWAQYQGYEAYTTTTDADGNETTTRNTYALVRGYQYANNYAIAQAKSIEDFNALIEKAEATRDDDMNVAGNKADFQEEIDEAKTTLADILAKATNDTKEADDAALAAATESLNAAIEAFLQSAEISPIVDIDFSNSFTPVTDPEDESIITSYVVKGAAGQMEFTYASVQTDPNEHGHYYQLGYNDLLNDVLRVGSAEAVVNIAEGDIPTANDVLRVEFDLWVGNLSKGFVTIELRNAANQRVAGFSYDKYNANVAYNDFNDEGNNGLDLRKYVSGLGASNVGDAAICVDANKSHFTLIADFKAETLKGSLENGTNGNVEGALVLLPTPAAVDDAEPDNKIAKFVITSSYASANSGAYSRCCWFDNLIIKKYQSSATGKNEAVAVKSIDAAPAAAAAIYTISGTKVNGLQKGINIVRNADGSVRKVFVK